MDLRNNQITIRELTANPGAKAILKKRFPQYTSPVMLGMAKGMTLKDVLALAGGHVSAEQIERTLEELNAL